MDLNKAIIVLENWYMYNHCQLLDNFYWSLPDNILLDIPKLPKDGIVPFDYSNPPKLGIFQKIDINLKPIKVLSSM